MFAVDPTAAAQQWISLMEPFAGQVPLVAPGITNNGAGWLLQFLGNCTACNVAAVAVHVYPDLSIETPLPECMSW